MAKFTPAVQELENTFSERQVGPFVDRGGSVGFDVRAYGAVLDGTTDDRNALADAITAAQASGIKVVTVAGGTALVGSNLTVPTGVTLRVLEGAKLKPANGVTVTINGAFEAGLYQTFDTSAGGTIAFGPGAVERVLPQWWGAKGDGATDCYAAVQAALDSISSVGGIVHLVAGTYLLKDTPRAPSSVVFEGAGMDTVLTVPANFSPTPISTTITTGVDFRAVVATATNARGVVFRDFRIEGNGDNQAPANMAGILMVDCEDCAVVDCEVNDIIFDGYNSDDTTRQFGVCTTNASRILILGGRYSKCGYECVAIRRGSKNVNVVGVHAYNGFRHAAQVSEGSTRTTFVGCVFLKVGAEAIGQYVSGLTIHDGVQTVMTGCITDLSVRVIGQTLDTTITGNIITTLQDRSAIEVGHEPDIGQTQRTVIVGNYIRAEAPTFGHHGVRVFHNSRGTIIQGNNIRATNGRGVSIEDTATGTVVSGNVIHAPNSSNVRVGDSASGVLITQNVADVDSTYGVAIEDTADNVVVELNDLSAITSGTKLLLGGSATNVSLRKNRGLVTENTGTATVANGSTSVAVPHGLGVTPDLRNIVVTPTNDLGNATKFWISNPTSTQFTINVDADPGAATATFAWTAAIN